MYHRQTKKLGSQLLLLTLTFVSTHSPDDGAKHFNSICAIFFYFIWQMSMFLFFFKPFL